MISRIHPSPIGPLTLTSDGDAIVEIRFGAHAVMTGSSPAIEEAIRQLDEYFARKRSLFTLRLAPRGTEFQLAVWRELERIPFGATISYRELAERIGRPAAVRAVGAANGANPIPIVIPCHRVIGANGSLTGYGGGLPIKQALLALEQHTLF